MAYKKDIQEFYLQLSQFSIEKSPNAMFWVNKNAEIKHVNPEACEILGYSYEELISMSVFNINPSFQKENWSKYWENIQKKKSVRYESGHKKKNGTEFPVEIISHFIKFQGEQFACSFAINITERKNAEALLIKANEEKEIMLKEVHHRVKNNLQVISSLIALQSYQIKDEKTKEIFTANENRIMSMARVHEMLYRSDNWSNIDYREYISELSNYLLTSIKGGNNKFKINIDLPNIQFNIETAIPLGLLINEILTNSFKHGFKNENQGEVYIKIEKTSRDKFLLNIGDNGTGCSDEELKKKSNSLGVTLIEGMVKQLKGKVERDNLKKGCHYCICFERINQSLTSKNAI